MQTQYEQVPKMIECIGGDSHTRYIHATNPDGTLGKLIAHAKGENIDDVKINAKELTKRYNAFPELCQMVRDLKDCVKRLSQDGLSQFDRDTEAQWEGEAHELLSRINPNYYRNANEKD